MSKTEHPSHDCDDCGVTHMAYSLHKEYKDNSFSKTLFNSSKIKSTILIEAFKAFSQYNKVYRYKDIHELEPYYEHENETMDAVKDLQKKGLVKVSDGFIILTPKGKKFIKSCINLGFEKNIV